MKLQIIKFNFQKFLYFILEKFVFHFTLYILHYLVKRTKGSITFITTIVHIQQYHRLTAYIHIRLNNILHDRVNRTSYKLYPTRSFSCTTSLFNIICFSNRLTTRLITFVIQRTFKVTCFQTFPCYNWWSFLCKLSSKPNI